MLKDQPSFHDNLAFIKLTCTCVHVNKRILYTLSGVGQGFRVGVGGGRMAQPDNFENKDGKMVHSDAF